MPPDPDRDESAAEREGQQPADLSAVRGVEHPHRPGRPAMMPPGLRPRRPAPRSEPRRRRLPSVPPGRRGFPGGALCGPPGASGGHRRKPPGRRAAQARAGRPRAPRPLRRAIDAPEPVVAEREIEHGVVRAAADVRPVDAGHASTTSIHEADTTSVTPPRPPVGRAGSHGSRDRFGTARPARARTPVPVSTPPASSC